MTEPARQWQMTRLAAGTYLLPSNDRSTLFLITRYREDGSAEDGAGRPVVGNYWQVAAMDWSDVEHEHAIDGDPLMWEKWEPILSMEPTRQQAVADAMKWSTNR